MTSEEFDVLDELYFLTDLKDLTSSLEMESGLVLPIIFNLYSKGWVVVMAGDERIAGLTWEDFQDRAEGHSYLATKSGLFAHNSR